MKGTADQPVCRALCYYILPSSSMQRSRHISWYPQKDGGAVVLLGHGTEHFANAVYPALQTALRLEGREGLVKARTVSQSGAVRLRTSSTAVTALRASGTTAEASLAPYLKPQECGNHANVRWAAVTDEDGLGLLFEGDGMNFSALPWTPAELENAADGPAGLRDAGAEADKD